MVDVLHTQDWEVVLQTVIPEVIAERTLRLVHIGEDFALDDDLGCGRDF